MKQATGKTHGKVILIGEHSVVYNQPCIALPFLDTTVTAIVTESKQHQILDCDFYQGNVQEMPELMEGLQSAIHATLQKLNQSNTPFHMSIKSTIPIERGMGSSAAVAGAAILGLYHFFEAPLSDNELFNLIQVSEKVTHGNPSGIDALTTTHQTAFYFQKEKEPIAFNIQLDADLIIADTGMMGKTKEAVSSIVKHLDLKETKTAIQTLGILTKQAKKAIIHHNAIELGNIMNKAHQQLQILNVSSKELDTLVHIANKNGALGSKLTGGGKGGCMITLCHPSKTHQIKTALEKQAAKVWSMSLKGELI